VDATLAMFLSQWCSGNIFEKFSVITEEIDPGSTANAVGVS
jgi:hypothetical protein